VGDINPFGAGLNAHSDLHSGGCCWAVR